MQLDKDIVEQMNSYGRSQTPFLFIIDFEMNRPQIFALDNIPDNISYAIGEKAPSSAENIIIDAFPESFELYNDKFDQVHQSIKQGDSYLLNLTCRTPIIASANLSQIYASAHAKYKLLYQDEFVCFSPEPFVKIENNKIASFPMKGTIDATIPDARKIIDGNPKELAEHYTIVDLIRNDLSRVATDVNVDDFRYVERIETAHGALLQQSTAIYGLLKSDWENHIGDIFAALLPAGSISGAPKKKTLEIIQAAEGTERGNYTGVFGIYDGETIDSGVMIRYIEKEADQYYFRSGGGITHISDAQEEYQEMINKIYVPILREHQDSASTDPSPALSYG